MSQAAKQPKEIIPEGLIDKTVPFRPSVYQKVHIMRAMAGETVAECMERIVLAAYIDSRRQNIQEENPWKKP